MSCSVAATARGCGFWQPSRNPSWLEDSRLPRPAVAPLWWLRRAATHTYTHRILTGARAAFAEVCLCAAMAGSGAQLPAVQILCAPRKVFLYIPKEGILTPEIRFPVIPLLRLELPKTGKPRSNSYAFFPIATSFKIVLDSQGAHS